MLLWREKLPETWLPMIRANLAPVLVDHAHLERKAASSALNLEKYTELHGRVRELNAIAIEELQHFDLVLGLLTERGLCRADREAIVALFPDLYEAALRPATPRNPS